MRSSLRQLPSTTDPFTRNKKETTVTAIVPIRNRILLKLVQTPEAKRGSLFIPESAVERPQEAEVVAVGAGYYEAGMWCEMPVVVGNRVLIGKYSGTTVSVNGEELFFVRADDILAVIGQSE